MLKPIFRIFWDICLLRRGPQVLPPSPLLLGLVLVCHWALGAALYLFSFPLVDSLLEAALGTLVLVAFTHALLHAARRGVRFRQTLIAMAGGELMVGLFMAPVLVLFYLQGTEVLAGMLYLFLVGWSVVICAHIFRHALGGSWAAGVAASASYTAVAYVISSVSVGGA